VRHIAAADTTSIWKNNHKLLPRLFAVSFECATKALGSFFMAAKPAAAAQSGVFVVDISGLNLPNSALGKIERAINGAVQTELGGLDLGRSGGFIPKRPIWRGIWILPKKIPVITDTSGLPSRSGR
jgi:hypothetical protein